MELLKFKRKNLKPILNLGLHNTFTWEAFKNPNAQAPS